MHTPGIEPGWRGWEPPIITPRSRVLNVRKMAEFMRTVVGKDDDAVEDVRPCILHCNPLCFHERDFESKIGACLLP